MARSTYPPALARPGRARELEADGSRTRYWVYGPETAPRTVVMVHGFRGDHHGLEPVVAQLPGYRVVVPDLPGFGESAPLLTRHTVGSYAAWLVMFVRQLPRHGDVVVLGHSFGSVVVAAALARGLPATSAVLVNPIGAPALSGPRGVMSRLAVLYYRLGAALPERIGTALLRSALVVRVMTVLLAKTRQRSLRRWILAEHLRYFGVFANRRMLLEAFEASVADDVSQYAEQIATPVLLIGGTRDDITSVEVHRRLVARFPSAELVLIEGVGHLIHYEKPDRAAEVIRSFLESGR